MAAEDKLIELVFPIQGIDLSTEFELQRINTTPKGLNVRGYEPTTNRARGGQRAGLAQYVPAQVNGSHVIQHLNYVVDPIGPGTGAGGTAGDGLLTGGDPNPQFLDPSTNNNADGLGPRNPGRYFRTGGSAIQHNRHVSTRPPTSGYMFRQQAQGSVTTPNLLNTLPPVSATFPVAVNVGNLIVAAVAVGWPPLQGGVHQAISVTDTLHNSFVQVGNFQFLDNPVESQEISLWAAVSVGTGLDMVTMTPVGAQTFLNSSGSNIAVLEYAVPLASPTDFTTGGVVLDNGVGGVIAWGTINVSTGKDLVLLLYRGSENPVSVPVSGLTHYIQRTIFAGDGLASNAFLYEVISTGVAQTPVSNTTDPDQFYAYIGASFKPHP